jgi:hypothetical protein
MPSKKQETDTEFFDDAIKDMGENTTEDEGAIGAEEWDPESAGQALRGVFIKAIPKATRYGVGYNVVLKDIDTKEYVKVWCKRVMLVNQLTDASPAVGSSVVFLYNGEKEGGNGRDFHSYQVRSSDNDDALWSKIQAEGYKLQAAFDQTGGRPAQDNAPAGSQLAPDEAPY